MEQKTQPGSKKNTGKALKPTSAIISKRPPGKEPSKKEVAAKRALAAKSNLPQAGDIALINSLKLKERAKNYQTIAFGKQKFKSVVFAAEWYEFSQFCEMLQLSKATVRKWLQKGWIAYSETGRVRLINRNDFEDMMRWFRKPATLGGSYLLFFLSNCDIL